MEYFLWPFFFLLLPVPFIVRHFLSYQHTGTDQQTNIIALRVPFYKQVSTFTTATNGKKVSHIKWPIIFTWLFCICAAARPVWYFETQIVPHNARNLVLALDTSGSMGNQDFDINGKPSTRLDSVKAVVNDFIQKRNGDEISLIVFGSEAFTYTPLTHDLRTVRLLLDEVNIGMAGELTAIGDALATSIANVAKLPANSRIVILLSDGNANAGVVKVQEAIKMAQKTGVKIYTIGIGAPPQRIRDFFGFEEVIDPSADLDEKTLFHIADSTGGQYYRAQTTEDLQAIYDTINSLEKIQQKGRSYRPRKELFFIPLSLALFCLLIAWYKRRGR